MTPREQQMLTREQWYALLQQEENDLTAEYEAADADFRQSNAETGRLQQKANVLGRQLKQLREYMQHVADTLPQNQYDNSEVIF